MGGLILFVLLFFVMLIAIPIMNIIGVVRRAAKNNMRTQSQRQQQTNATSSSSTQHVNKRFDKSKAEDVEFEEM